MRSGLTKLLHPVAGRPLISYVLRTARALRPDRFALVVSPGARAQFAPVVDGLPIRWIIQREALGTGHAARRAASALKGFSGHVLVLAGDVPGITAATLRDFVAVCTRQAGPGGVLTAIRTVPTGYGRIVRDGGDAIERIVEERDASADEAAITEVNTGVLCCEAAWFLSALNALTPRNAQGEYYLTDLARVAAQTGRPLRAVRAAASDEFVGVNSRAELAAATALMRRRIVDGHLAAGVSFVDPDRAYIDADVTIGVDTVIGPGCVLQGATAIGARCVCDAGVVITDCRIGGDVHIKPYSVLEASRVRAGCVIGPFARLRPGARLDAGVHIGNFVEVKKSWLKRGVKANHLTYLGDATIGERTNVGCGTITCNYDGARKHPTTIG
ncbi:MAG: bifunctional UDP-N-acetylglucosamine diphosphorylase/glucosamine-1-phosphate N-acetyltransferase GlmU, partial [Deltaproteobacteria bacterium]|nr:bifunctional UDP-N-acetylglucosamine diphosphorylase/glucosamine-1-phosphate N-acetyltransferase GlmU [Deltaproteobacteria bacterium]